ncbi:MAG: ATP-dependent sacrificial sulfur transferase LarE [Deltaproteobacteria bacterium]|nr:ATP-dependent sacrificial sulfur transferase LarE [Deltaproteobacteria bacterium]
MTLPQDIPAEAEAARTRREEDLKRKLGLLSGWITSQESVIVALSGGVDSTLVAYLAHRSLGRRSLAVTSGSPALKRSDLALTTRLTSGWGMAHRVIHTAEMENPGYSSNPQDRCYHCKNTLYADLERIAEQEGYKIVLSGTNSDDAEDFRPGLRAAREHGVQAPLALFALGKDDVRALAALLGLPNHDKPQSACLASRVPYGQPITVGALGMVEAAEGLLQSAGIGQSRLRHHGTVARIEVSPEDFPRLLAQRERIVSGLKELGYAYITLDLEGFRSGSMNEVLEDPQG